MKKTLKNKENIIILGVSLVAFIAGCFAIGWIWALLIVGVADAILFMPYLLDQRNKKRKPKTKPLIKTGQEKKKKSTKKKKKIWKILLLICMVLAVLIILACTAFAFYIVKNAPKFDPNKLYQQEASIIYAKDGTIMTKLGTEKREKITYDELPEVLVDAIVATEDSRFFQHNGFDLPRFLKASVKQVLTRSGGGASTITMQVVKNNFTSTDQTITRKFTDIYMAIFQVEKNYTKQEIIEFYVNAPYLGSGAYGVEQACQTYFGKSAKDINLAEAAMIAGLFQAPNAYDPRQHPEKAEERRKQVLYLMERHGYISKEEKEAAEKMDVESLLYTTPSQEKTDYQAFIDTVVAEVVQNTKSAQYPDGMDPYVIPMEIYTTMDREKQEHINSIMSGESFKWENDVVDAGIMVLDNKTGEIVAVGAGRHRSGERQYNTATMINKQIGSTAKPLYDYAPGIEYQNWGTYKLFMDEEYGYTGGNGISNWDRKYNGLLTMRDALAQSRNIPALKAFQQNKNSNIKSFVTNLGLHPQLENNIVHEAHALGGYTGESPLSMATAYAAFGNGGYYITPHSYRKIVLRDTGKTIEPKVEKKRVMSEETAWMMSSLLQSATSGLYNQANLGNGIVYGAKTGTSNYSETTIKQWGFGADAVNDLWVNSVSPDYAISVWYGYQKIVKGYTSNSYTASHRRLFQAVAKGVYKAGSNWTKPDGIIEVEIENGTEPAKLPSEYTPQGLRIKEYFKKGTEPTEVSDRFNTPDNVKNLKSSLKGNTLTLKWDEVKPDALQDSTVEQWAKSLASSAAGINTLITNRKNENASYLGNVIYQVYSKDKSGNLKLVKEVTTTTTDLTVTPTDPTTYVVKTTYSNMKHNQSSGSEIKISLDNVESVITAELQGEKTITLQVGDTYTEPTKPVIVLENLTDVTNKATIKKVIKNKQGIEITLDQLVTTVPTTYTITYTIAYGDFTDTITKTIVVE